MSSTNGSQNLLTNVFRPVYRYEIPTGGSTAMFVPRLDVCNIDVLAANSISGFNAAIGDENENVYVGSNAGNDYSNLRGCSNVTALGFNAAGSISNTKNSVYIGYNAGANALDSSANVTLGPDTKGNGISNIYIGSNTGSLGTGSNNILIGHNLTGTNLSNTLLIGPTPTIYGNLSTRKVGIGRDPSYNMDISGDSRISYRLGVGMAPGTATDMCDNPLTNVPHSLDVSGYTFIRGALGINNDPADFTLNMNGNFKFDDGAGRMILQKDPSGNSTFSYESYAPGSRAIFSIKGDLCADAFIVPGATFSGTVTGGTVVAINDISGPYAYISNARANIVYGQDVSGFRGRFDRVDATDISGSSGTITTLTATTFSSANFSTSNIVLPGYLRNALTPTTFDISGGRFRTAAGAVSNPAYGFLTDPSSGMYSPQTNTIAFSTGGQSYLCVSSNLVGMGTLNPQTRLHLKASNELAGTSVPYELLRLEWSDQPGAGFNQEIGMGTKISFYTPSNDVTGATTEGASVAAVRISGGENDLTTDLTMSTRLTGDVAVVERLRYITLSNRLAVAGDISASGGVVAGFVRNNLTPSTYDISGGNFRGGAGAVSNPTYAFIADPSAGLYRPGANQFGVAVGGVQRLVISNSNVGIGRAVPTATLDVSGDVSANGFLASTYLRNAIVPTTLDISGGNISNSLTTRSSNFIGRGTASNSVAGFVLSNGTLRIDGSDTFMVAIGESTNTLATSSNGITWTSRGKTIFTSVGRGVAWNGSLWVAVGNGTNTIATSTDGITWTGLGSIIFSTQANSIAWGGNVWVAGGVGTNTLAYSTDGSNWTGLGTSIFSGGTNFAAWGGNIWVAGGGGGNTLAYSSDGSNWTGLGTSIFSSAANGIAWNGSLWVAVGSGTNVFATSPDGINWTGRGGSGVFSTAGIAVAWNGSLWVATGQGTNTLAYSSDGSNWTGAGASIFTTNGRCVAWNGYVWAAGGQGTNSLAYSFDGSNWTGAGTGALNLLTRGIAGRRYVLPVTDPHTGQGNIQFGGAIVGSNADTSNRIGGVTLSNTTIGIGTTAPYGALDISGQGSTIYVGATANTNGLIIQGYSNSGYIRPQLAGSALYLGAESTNTAIITKTGIGIHKAAPAYALDICCTAVSSGVNILGSNAQVNLSNPGTSGSIQLYNNGIHHGLFTNTTMPLYLYAGNVVRMCISANGNVGVGTTTPGPYLMDLVSASTTNAAINMNTWPRIDNASNTTIVRGTIGIVGNTINWSNAQQNTINTGLMTLVLSNAAGCSFKINRSGIWSISWMLGISNGFSSWIDASTNENSNVALNTAGTYLISYAQAESGTLSSGSWTGYLPSNASTFYKVRTNSAALTLNANSNYFTATFLTETSNAGGNFPFR